MAQFTGPRHREKEGRDGGVEVERGREKEDGKGGGGARERYTDVKKEEMERAIADRSGWDIRLARVGFAGFVAHFAVIRHS
jgi:hypothetical protein